MEKKLSLSNIVNQFKDAQTTEQSELGKEVIAQEAVVEVDAVVEAEPVVATDEVVKEAAAKAEPEIVMDADVLKGIAKEAAESANVAMHKEASEFGKLFAHSFLEEVEIAGVTKQANDNAYEATVQVIQDGQFQEKLASIYAESRELTRLAVVGRDAFNKTVDALDKQASDKLMGDLPLALASATQGAYDLTVQVLNEAQ